jgi:hypothetical protein
MEKKKINNKTRVCQNCCESFDIKILYWVNKESHYSLHCINCIEKEHLTISHPFITIKNKK